MSVSVTRVSLVGLDETVGVLTLRDRTAGPIGPTHDHELG
jgi:hypothetical protein